MSEVTAPGSPYKLNLSVVKTGLLTVIPMLVIIAITQPQSPDLIAQLARAAMAETTAGATWWTSWYGGISTPSYSAITPELMRVAGVWTVGVIASLVTVYAAARLLEGRAHARLAVVLVSLGVTSDLISGRITFAVGAAFATLALMFLLHRRLALAVVCAAASSLASPLAGMFIGMIMLCRAVETGQRRDSAMLIAAAAIPALIIEVLFPLPGSMPMPPFHIALAATAYLFAWFSNGGAFSRRLTVLFACATLFFSVVPSPIGLNILRLPMIFIGPFLAVTSNASRRRFAITIFLSITWLLIAASRDIIMGSSDSSHKEFYAPLLAQLPSNTATNRIEVIDPATHGPALYVAPTVPIARGWERQVDVTRNAMFYDKTLNSDNYRQWLDDLAVKWVALPNTSLDYASEQEADLVRGGLPYLHEVWQNNDWKLYEVANATSMSTGVASVQRVAADSIELAATAGGEGDIKIAWTRGLTLVSTSGDKNGTVERVDDRVHYSVPAAGTYVLSNNAER